MAQPSGDDLMGRVMDALRQLNSDIPGILVVLEYLRETFGVAIQTVQVGPSDQAANRGRGWGRGGRGGRGRRSKFRRGMGHGHVP